MPWTLCPSSFKHELFLFPQPSEGTDELARSCEGQGDRADHEVLLHRPEKRSECVKSPVRRTVSQSLGNWAMKVA